MKSKDKLTASLVVLIVIALDQLSKWAVLDGLNLQNDPRAIEILPFFNLVMVWNRGISFGLFSSHSDMGPYLLIALAFLLVGFLSVFLWRAQGFLPRFAAGMVIGGALGNIIDRFRFGAVADFLDFHIHGWHYPAFNVADSAIVIGVAFLLYDGFFGSKSKENEKTDSIAL